MKKFRSVNDILRHGERLGALTGRWIGSLLPFSNPGGLFFFFPFCHIGGAERVHSDIVNCLAHQHPWVFFTKWSSRPAALRTEFDRAAHTFNWTVVLKYTYPLSAGIMAGLINRHPKAVVFGSNTLFYYKMLPYLAPHVKTVDLLHAFGGGAEDFSLPVADRIDIRVVINQDTRAQLSKQYKKNGIRHNLLERVRIIGNSIHIPPSLPGKSREGEIKVLFVGRASAEKRIHLMGSIADLCDRRGIPVKITLAGDIPPGSMDKTAASRCAFAGEIHDSAEMERLYQDAHLLLVTSSREGFPMVIMEAMAHGVVPVSTAVGGIPEHVKSGVNGWLVENYQDEELIVEQACAIIQQACFHRQQLETMSTAAYRYALDSFSPELFCRSYRQLLTNDREPEDA